MKRAAISELKKKEKGYLVADFTLHIWAIFSKNEGMG